jgi:hypothetical protein
MTHFALVQVAAKDVTGAVRLPDPQTETPIAYYAVDSLRTDTLRQLLDLAPSEYFMFHRDTCPTLGVTNLNQWIASPKIQVIVGSYVDRATNLVIYLRQDDAEFFNKFDMCACLIHRDLLFQAGDALGLEGRIHRFMIDNQSDPHLVYFAKGMLVDVQRTLPDLHPLGACANCGRPMAQVCKFCPICAKQHSRLLAINESREFIHGLLLGVGLHWSEIYLGSILHLLWEEFNKTSGREEEWASRVAKANHAEYNRWIYF